LLVKIGAFPKTSRKFTMPLLNTFYLIAMSKDPAFLFYSSDFLTGTMFMDNDQVGKYIRLMCAQHQKGRLTEKDMLKICVTHDEDIFSKFTKDESGHYYNERLEEEVERRKAYSESRRNNRKKKEDMIDTSLSYVTHMETETETEDIIKDEVLDKPIEEKTKRFVKPTIQQLETYMEEREMNNVANRFYDYYESNGWKVGKNSMKDWKAAVRNWEPNHKKIGAQSTNKLQLATL
jgi:hypothetical protein